MEIAQADSLFTIEKTSGGIHWIVFNDTISIIALTLGVGIFIISYFAGGRENKSRIFFSIIFSLLVSFFSMPLFIKACEWLGIAGTPWGDIALVTFVMIFVAAVASNAYEIVTVSAKEARPPD